MISKSTIDEIFNKADIVEVVSGYVTLKKAGASYKGLSPFTNEKTPSFMVSPSKGIFKCFSSGKGGSVVDFVMEQERCTYPEALRWLAEKYNIPVQEDGKREDTSAKHEALAALEARQANFVAALPNSTAQEYMLGRGFTGETMLKFGVGYCKPGAHDKMQGRVTFPIHGLNGKLVSFGGRLLEKDDNRPKYLNGEESELYTKSKVLYNLHRAKQEMVRAGRVYLVEGYTDVMAMDQHGIHNVVATCGTALTADQCALLRKFVAEVVVVYDGDAPGVKAANRGVELMLEADLVVRLVMIPDNLDPFDYLMGQGADAFRALPENDFVVYRMAQLSEFSRKDPARQADCIRSLCGTISHVRDLVLRSVYRNQVSSLFKVDERMLDAYIGPQKEISPIEHRTREEHEEAELLVLLYECGDQKMLINWERGTMAQCTVKDYVIQSLEEDGLELHETHLLPMYQYMVQHYHDDKWHEMPIVQWPDGLRQRMTDVLTNMSLPPLDADELKKYTIDLVNRVKYNAVLEMLEATNLLLAEATEDDEVIQVLEHKQKLTTVARKLGAYYGATVR